MSKADQEAEAYTEAETKARAAAALKVMLATPHKPHAKLGGRAEADPPRRSRQEKNRQA